MTPSDVERIFDRVRTHNFQPLNEKDFTVDRTLGEEGIADLDDDWRVRLLATRDLVHAGVDAAEPISDGLFDEDVQVRYVCATALGALRARAAVPSLERVVREDPQAIARSQAITALGQIVSKDSLALLGAVRADDPSRDVRHQAELAIDRIEKGAGPSDALSDAYRALDPSTFEQLALDQHAPAFELPDTDGSAHSLSDLVAAHSWTLLIWIFADWCPVCHREFDELIELREAFAEADVAVATLETHGRYRGRVMLGKELDPAYWFAEESVRDTYTDRIWWPHLLDRAGAVGATYGVDPMAYAVHAEYVNRPATIVIDADGIVRFAYYGTYWGDRPSVEETLEMIRSERFEFEHPKRRSLPAE